MPQMKTKLINAFADSELDCAQWHDDALAKLADIVLRTMHDPIDEELLAPGEPYRIQKAINVPESEGIKRRRTAWNTILDHMGNA